MATRIPRVAPVKWPHPGGEAPSTGAPSTGGAGGRLGAALDTALPGVSSLARSPPSGTPNFSRVTLLPSVTAVAVERRRGGLLVVCIRPETSFDTQGLFIR